jgi:hypothetical protein
MNLSSLVPSLLSIGTTIGTAIPGLKKPKKSQASQAAAAKTTSDMVGAIVGAAGSGTATSRGLALTEALRGASEFAGEASSQGELARQNDLDHQKAKGERNKRLAAFGADLGTGLGEMAAGLVGPEEEEAGGEPEVGTEGKHIGASQAAYTLPEGQRGDLEVEQPMLGDDYETQMLIDEVSKQGITGGLPEPGEKPQLEEQMFAQTQVSELFKKPGLAPALEKQLESKLQMKELMLSEAERQGLPIETYLARINRRLELRPGQSSGNPYGVQTDYGMGEEE